MADKIVFLLKNLESGETHRLTDQLIIGRVKADLIYSTDLQMSSQHVQISIRDNKVYLMDLGSTNGSFINEKRVAPQVPAPLSHEDKIRIGGQKFTLLVESGSLSAAATAVQQQAKFNPLDAKSGDTFAGNLELGTAMADLNNLPKTLAESKAAAPKALPNIPVHVSTPKVTAKPSIPAKDEKSMTGFVIAIIVSLVLIGVLLLLYSYDFFALDS